MSLSVKFSAELEAFIRALGLVSADGSVDPTWFEHPLDRLGTIVSNTIQRAALLDLLDRILPQGQRPPTDRAPGAGSERLYPLLDATWRGNIYLAIDDDTLGVVASIATPAGVSPSARVDCRLPLVDLSTGLRAIAGSPDGPLSLSITAQWPAGTHPSSVAATASIDVTGGASVRVRLMDLDPAAPAGTSTELDPTRLGPETVRVLTSLLEAVLSEVTETDPGVLRLAAHLPGVLGLLAPLDPLPIASLKGDPGALRRWFAGIAADPVKLKAWFTHVSHLAGAGLPDAAAPVSGGGTPPDPLRVPLIDLGNGATLDMTLAARQPAGGLPACLLFGVALQLTSAVARVEGGATLLSVPLDAGVAPVVAVQQAHLILVAPANGKLIDHAPEIEVRQVSAGCRWDGAQLRPSLELDGVIIDGVSYSRLDLSNANAVLDAARMEIRAELVKRIGTDGKGRALETLIGFKPPLRDDTSLNLLDLAAFAHDPTRAIAAVHRAALADPTHHWGFVFEDIATLLGFARPSGSGTIAEPWSAMMATEPFASLSLVAWNALPVEARTSAVAVQQLRLGLRVSVDAMPWSVGWTAEFMAFDLPAAAKAVTRITGSQQLAMTLKGMTLAPSASGLAVAATSLAASFGWVPGSRPSWSVDVEDLVLTGHAGATDPVTLSFPGSGFDPALGDFGLDIPVPTLLAAVRLLCAEAMHGWGGDTAYRLAGLLGVHRDVVGLPDDWPLIAPPDATDLGSLMADLPGAFEQHLLRLATGISADGTPFSLAALQLVRSIVSGTKASWLSVPAAPPLLAGSGNYEDPWVIPLADQSVELIGWFEPSGPAAGWAAANASRLAQAADGASFVALLRTLPIAQLGVAAALQGRLDGAAGAELDQLSQWLSGGDGVVSAAAQILESDLWTTGRPLIGAHADQPASPLAIDQIIDQVAAWSQGAPHAVLLMGPEFSDHRIWNAFLARAEPSRALGAHFDFRVPGADPTTLDLSRIDAVAAHYTVDLPLGPRAQQLSQLARAVERVAQLTVQQPIYIVAHSTAGAVAREYAAANAVRVAGIVTIGTPHGASPFEPLSDPLLAGGIRFAQRLWPTRSTPAPASGAARAVSQLALALDTAHAYPAEAFAGVRADLVDAVRGLAIPGWLGIELIGELVEDLLASANIAIAAWQPPTHFAFGARLLTDRQPNELGDIGVQGRLRVDAGRFALRTNGEAGTPTPSRPARAVSARMDIARAGAWLVGNPNAAQRLRRIELAASVSMAAGGASRGVDVVVAVDLHDLALSGTAVAHAGLAEWATLTSLPARVRLASAAPGPGTPDAFALAILQAFGIVVIDPSGGVDLALDQLQTLGARPAETLGTRLGAIVDAVANQVGAVPIDDDDGWALGSRDVPIELRVTRRAPWRLQLRTTESGAAGSWPLADGVGLTLDAELALPSFTPACSAKAQIGDASLAWASDTGRLLLATGRGEAVTLLPAASAETLRAALIPRLPALLAPPIVTAALGGLLGGAVAIRGIDQLLVAPGKWLLSANALGNADGTGLSAARVVGLLQAIADAVGLQREPTGIALPAGLTLSATGAEPVSLALAGSVALDASGDRLGLSLALDVAGAAVANGPLRVTPSGTVSTDIALPGAWGRIGLTFGAGEAGITLSVTAGGEVINLLPVFSGFGVLAVGTARALLPHVLQAVVERISPAPQVPTGLLRSGLQVAQALGLYGFDAQGFETSERSAVLASMLDPGWLAARVASAPAVIAALVPVFVDPNPLVRLPGTVSAPGSTLRWEYPMPGGGKLLAVLGWAGAGAGAAATPVVTIGAQDVAIGPLVVDVMSVGYAGAVDCHLALHLDAGGEFGFLRPALDIALDIGTAGAAVAFAFFPLGAAASADFSIRMAPQFGLVLSPRAPWVLLEKWGVPLVGKLLVTAFDAKLAAPIWAGGPTVRSVLDSSGLIVRGSVPPRLSAPMPQPAALGLRALLAVLAGARIELSPTLGLSFAADAPSGRRGLRLQGQQEVDTESLAISLRFGKARWLEDPAAGVTLWLLQDIAGDIPVKISPGLSVVGLGTVIGGVAGKPLLDGAFTLDALGGFMFFDAGFLREQGGVPEFALNVSGIGAALQLDGALVRVSSDDGDSFLKKILPAQLQSPFDLALSWRDGSGLAVYGGTSAHTLEATWPLDVDLVVMRLNELYLALTRAGAVTTVQAALSGTADIGPLHGAIQRVGLKVSIDRAGARLAFRAPDGVGLSIDAGVVSGGGFLFIDEAHGQYAGGLQLNIEMLTLTAIGLLNTRMPDGSPIPGPLGLPGFSLLIIITADFPPIQLGFGFTLNGVGGLLGLNRTINVPALRAGARDRALDTMMFPPDPVTNAARIVRTLSAVFPVAVDRFVIGPMVRLAWGTPPILTLDLAILIEIPAPIVIALLGRIRLALPRDDESAVVRINLDVIGILDFGAGEVSIDAGLYDSTVAGFALTGQMALRARWKRDPTFALAIGGFHPAFKPPAGFPSLERMAISLATGDNPRLRLEAYMAVTSNTVQFGSRIDFHAEAAGCAADAMLAFDALIYLSPFGLQADIAGMAAITFEGAVICAVNLAISLSGPSPWHVWGRAEVQILFIQATISFDARIGLANSPSPAPAADLVALLAEAIGHAANWSAQAPAGEACIMLTQRAGGGDVVAHPLGGLAFRQRVLPFGVALDHFGASSIAGPNRFDITAVSAGAVVVDADDRSVLTDDFAPGQFFALTDDEKLSRPSFESFVSGVGLRFDAIAVDDLGAAEAAVFDFDYIVVDTQADGSAPGNLILSGAVAIALSAFGAAAAGLARRAGMQRFTTSVAQVALQPARFGIITDEGPTAAMPVTGMLPTDHEAGRGAAGGPVMQGPAMNHTVAAREAARWRAQGVRGAVAVRLTEPAT